MAAISTALSLNHHSVGEESVQHALILFFLAFAKVDFNPDDVEPFLDLRGVHKEVWFPHECLAFTVQTARLGYTPASNVLSTFMQPSSAN